jgi:hypothetical protein
MLENHSTFLKHLDAEGIKLVNIGSEDLSTGNQKLVLGLTWTLILKYEMAKVGNESDLFSWVKSVVASKGVFLKGAWAQAFTDGKAFCALGAPRACPPRASRTRRGSSSRAEPPQQ